MHEVSVAQSLLDIAIKQCREAGYQRINSILLKIGEAAGIQIDALRFAFEIIKKDTIAEGAELIIQTEPLTAICMDCNNTILCSEDFVYECPVCKGNYLRIIKGRELDILELDVD